MKKIIVFAFVATLAIAGCKKKEDGIAGTWKVTAATANPAITINGTSTTDVYTYIYPDQCRQDNLYIFNDNGTVIFDEGATKCDTSDEQQTSATYSINGSTLTIIDDDTLALTGFSVNEDHMQFSIPNSSLAGQTTSIALIFSRQ